MAFYPPLVLDHQPPSGLRHGSQSWMCEGGDVNGPDMGDGQMALDGVFSLYISNLHQPHSFLGRIRSRKKIENQRDREKIEAAARSKMSRWSTGSCGSQWVFLGSLPRSWKSVKVVQYSQNWARALLGSCTVFRVSSLMCCVVVLRVQRSVCCELCLSL